MGNQSLCPRFEKAFQLLGKRWVGVIIRVLSNGPMRFNEMAELIPHISQKVLSERLKELEDQDILVREVYPESPVRIEYRLTEKGEAIKPVLDEVQNWADKWVDLESE
ncbi:MAG: helix-turn-helix domain-containing protein [Heyndrickxia faecalis]|jgi:DNA-binding HxlR family transcriptional regulator|uniref:Helix-turn-helix domain-containing protein n=1 Tax=Heyndrickxia faecalis TaxID=2824910 RepID=A0AAU7WF81_9BACI|nr:MULTISPECIES: helix-turn-helix domain-containing protein [Heyndrickxia]NWN94405.1 helix-turn-helix transcriptional regulator [Bacillus sp. (in: firmicutes)]APB38189.1 transcriptional regulator [Heyndrickxia coagulans]MED4866978.1 helix-turn-helix domain-containing protein [Weizmannia sp. CD-2023]QPG53923.1 helix-turn-helix transcriptional regulator [Heyndrickxia coagulans]UXC22864.1 helix-turn-helix transcriptional regulator [Heyndrickxia coagulans]